MAADTVEVKSSYKPAELRTATEGEERIMIVWR